MNDHEKVDLLISYDVKKKLKLKVFRSFMAERAAGERDPLCLGHSIFRTEPIPLLLLPCLFLIRLRYPFTGRLKERVFQSPAGRT